MLEALESSGRRSEADACWSWSLLSKVVSGRRLCRRSFPASPRTMMSIKASLLLRVLDIAKLVAVDVRVDEFTTETTKPTSRSHVDSHTPADLHSMQSACSVTLRSRLP